MFDRASGSLASASAAAPKRVRNLAQRWIFASGRALRTPERAWAAWRGLGAALEAICNRRGAAHSLVAPDVLGGGQR